MSSKGHEHQLHFLWLGDSADLACCEKRLKPAQKTIQSESFIRALITKKPQIKQYNSANGINIQRDKITQITNPFPTPSSPIKIYRCSRFLSASENKSCTITHWSCDFLFIPINVDKMPAFPSLATVTDVHGYKAERPLCTA